VGCVWGGFLKFRSYGQTGEDFLKEGEKGGGKHEFGMGQYKLWQFWGGELPL